MREDKMEGNRQRGHQSRSAEHLVQNFYIVMPNAGAGVGVTEDSQAENVLQAIRAALGSAPAEPRLAAKDVTLEDVGREWFQNHASTWAPSYRGRLKNRLETYLLGDLGARTISSISPPDI